MNIKALSKILFIAIFCVGCFPANSIPPKSQKIELDSASKVEVSIRMKSGRLNLAGGAPHLFWADYHYNSPLYKPVVEYELQENTGKLYIDQKYTPSIGAFARGDALNEWNLSLNNDVPLDLTVEFDRGVGEFTLGELSLDRLKIIQGRGDLNVNLNHKRKKDLMVIVNGGLGKMDISLPSGVGVKVLNRRGASTVTLGDYEKIDDGYINMDYKTSDVKIFIDVRSGSGAINIK